MCCLLLLYICEKFCKDISDGTRVMEQTQMMEVLTDGWTDTKNLGGYNIKHSPLFVGGIKMTGYIPNLSIY